MALKPEYCRYCRCQLVGYEVRGFLGGYCTTCLLDRLRSEDGVGGVPTRIDESGHHEYAFLCTRCQGTGHVYAGTRVDDSYCFSCGGYGFILRTRERVSRTAKWWDTFQKNRQPPSH